MGYQVLARKWRPSIFKEMVGQSHVLRALTNALDNGRLHHAYLFTGTRGVGKTTIARIFAKSLNCETGISSTPCNRCGICKEINDGRFVDLIEVDAASRTKVEDTRELLDNVQYAATRGRYKVYLIDEVHMLSAHSFNALLKTLEEPPQHVKFLLATTDPQKLPVTILSRCLQFNLKRLPPDMIQEYLTLVLSKEQIEAESRALKQLANAADGSMRDALSLLDQAIAYSGGQLTSNDIHEMLGTIEQNHILELLQALAANDAEALLHHVHNLAEQAPDFDTILTDLIALLYRIALQQTVPTALDENEEHKETIISLAETISPQDVQLYYQIALTGRENLSLSPDQRIGFEMLMLRMLAFRPVSSQDDVTAESNPKPIETAQQSSKPTNPAAGPQPTTATKPAQRYTDSIESKAHAETVTADSEKWHTIVDSLKLSGLVKQLALNSLYRGKEGNTITLEVDRNGERLCSPQLVSRLEKALQHYFSEPVKLSFKSIESQPDNSETPAMRQQRQTKERLEAARTSISNDPNVKILQDNFNARIVTESIKPLS